jgi:hypothetical protein
MILSLILVFIPYLLDDYSPEICVVFNKSSISTGNPPYYSMQAQVNYTQEFYDYAGIYEGCHSSVKVDMESCAAKFPQNFTCMVDAHYDERHPRINYIYTEDEMSTMRLKFTGIIASIYAVFFVLFVFMTLFLWMVDKIGECFLPKLSDRDLKKNRIKKSDYKLTMGTSELDMSSLLGNPFASDPSLTNYLAETALENNDAVTFLACLLFPIFIVIILFGIYFGVTYYWKVEGLVLMEFCIGYTFFIFCVFVFLYALAAHGTKYYLTSTRSICVIRLLFTTWIYQFPYQDIDSIVLQGYEKGSIAVRSKSLHVEVKLFSSLPNLRFIEDFLNRKMSQYDEYDPDYEDAIHKLANHE